MFINAEKSSELQKMLDDHYFVAGGKLKQAIDNAQQKAKDTQGRYGTNLSYIIKTADRIGNVAFLDGLSIKKEKNESMQNAILRRDFNNRFKNKLITVFETSDTVKIDQIKKYIFILA